MNKICMWYRQKTLIWELFFTILKRLYILIANIFPAGFCWVSELVSQSALQLYHVERGSKGWNIWTITALQAFEQQSCDFGTVRSVPSDLSYLSDGSIWTTNDRKTWLCCTHCLEICNQCRKPFFWLQCLWFSDRIHKKWAKLSGSLGSNMIAEDSLES